METKTGTNIHFVQLEAYSAPKITETVSKDWVLYGEHNSYYQELIDRYNGSTTNNAVINNIIKLAYGKGVKAKDARLKPNDYARFISLVSKDTLKRVITDAKMLGNYAFQLLYDSKDELVKVEHVPVQLLAAEKCNKKGEIEAYYYSDNWKDTKKFVPKRINAYGFGGKIQILFGGNYTVGQKYYSNIDYLGAIPYCKLEEEVANYLINEVQNSFAPTTIVNFNNGVPDEEKQTLIVNKVEGKLTGAKGKKVVVAFNLDETKKTTVDSIPLDNAPEHYKYISEEATAKIMMGHNVTSPLLFGISTNTGFSANADELRNSHILFNNMVIKPLQEMIIDSLEKILADLGITLNLYFEELQPLDSEGDLTNTKQSQMQMSAEETPYEFADALIEKGEQLGSKWMLIDETEVDLEIEPVLDAEIELLNHKKQPSKLSKFARAIIGRPNAKSEQDATIDGAKFITRYKYTGSQSPERQFCQRMMSSDRVYRKEDIVNTDSKSVNDGFGHNGQSYDLFLYKGGPRCRHKWMRQTYVSFEGVDIDVSNPNATQISTAKAEKAGYRVRNPREVSMIPNDMPNNGFYPI